MRNASSLRFICRTLFDGLLGLALFMAVAGFVARSNSGEPAPGIGDIFAFSAKAAEMIEAPAAEGPAAVAALVQSAVPVPAAEAPRTPRVSRQASFVLLAGVFSALFAFNMGIVRHLRRAYASPR